MALLSHKGVLIDDRLGAGPPKSVGGRKAAVFDSSTRPEPIEYRVSAAASPMGASVVELSPVSAGRPTPSPEAIPGRDLLAHRADAPPLGLADKVELREPTLERLEQEVLTRAEELIIDPVRRNRKVELPVLGITSVWGLPCVIRADGRYWLVTRANEDPLLAQHAGQFPAPEEVCDYVQALPKMGVRPDDIHALHEIDWIPGQVARYSIPPTPTIRRREELGLRVLRRVWNAGSKVAMGAAMAPIAVAAGVAALIGTDPVLVGVARHPEAELLVHVELCRWEWA